jgi:hypothetical protein
MLPTDQHSKLKPYTTTTTNVDEATMTLSVDSNHLPAKATQDR